MSAASPLDPWTATPCLLVVTGARALSPHHRAAPGTRATEGWAWWTLAHLLDGLPTGSSVLAGRCPECPDEWVMTLAAARRFRRVEYDLAGVRWVNDGAVGRWREAAGACTDPHERNAALVAAAVAAQAKGWTVLAHALLAPWATTAGTTRTADALAAAGLPLVRWTCPRVLVEGPAPGVVASAA